jgi:hypothetical protein
VCTEPGEVGILRSLLDLILYFWIIFKVDVLKIVVQKQEAEVTCLNFGALFYGSTIFANHF